MQPVAPISQPLNEVQLMLLRLFSRPMNSQDISAIRDMLTTYYETLLQKELEAVIEQKQITKEDFQTILHEDQRTK